MQHPLVKPGRSGATLVLGAILLSCVVLGMPAPSRAQPGFVATVTRSRADEKAEAFLERAYPGSRRSLDPRFSTGSGVFRAYFVGLPDGRCVRAELETQFSTLPGRTTPSAFLELNEKPLLSPTSWKVAASAVGPVRLGMKAAAVREACSRYPVLVQPVGNDLAISYFGQRLLVVRMAGSTVARIEVSDARLKTAQGVGPGTTLAELAEQYGSGEVLLASGGLCLTFDAKCPGRGFQVARPAGAGEPTWSALLKTNPRVRSLVVAGGPGAFAAETRATGLPRATRSHAGEAPGAFLKRAFPGCSSVAEPERSQADGYRSYLVQLPGGVMHRVELEPVVRGGRSAPLTLTSTEVRTPFKWQLTAGALGPIRLGMKTAQVEGACDPYAVSVTPANVSTEGGNARGLAVTYFGKRLAEIELGERGTVSGIRVLDRRWTTPQRVGVGSSLRELVRLYGNGELIIGESEIWVVFERASAGRSFLLAHPVPADDGKPLWPVLVKANPKVSVVRIATN